MWMDSWSKGLDSGRADGLWWLLRQRGGFRWLAWLVSLMSFFKLDLALVSLVLHGLGIGFDDLFKMWNGCL